ncbi:MAG TPA: hypothetical protein VJB67_00560 [Patescibacteria group bacterium]|nr:hypothetical protein [Patescibacteria group bacterium]
MKNPERGRLVKTSPEGEQTYESTSRKLDIEMEDLNETEKLRDFLCAKSIAYKTPQAIKDILRPFEIREASKAELHKLMNKISGKKADEIIPFLTKTEEKKDGLFENIL